MLRTRKKDINLKPNRILDKRSSRGMLYENEELRLRTIHINDEVDKGQNSIKKLKKENEHLKREIWGLRDECEKLETMLKKVYGAIEESGAFEGLGLSPDTRTKMLEFPASLGRSRASFRRESETTEESLAESEEELDLEDFQRLEEDSNLNETDLEKLCKDELENENSGFHIPFPATESCHQMSTASDSEVIISQKDPVSYSPFSLEKDNEYFSQSEIFAKETPPPLPSPTPIIEITPAFSSLLETSPATEGVPKELPSIPEKNRFTTTVSVEPPPAEIQEAPIHQDPLPDLQKRRKSFAEKFKNGGHIPEPFSFSKSVPNLNSLEEESPNLGQVNPPLSQSVIDNEIEWDGNVLVGHIETGNGVSGKSSYKLADFRVEEIIDELEKIMGTGFDQVQSVRLMASNGPISVFISFLSSEIIEPLIERGIMELRNGNVRMRLVGATKKCSVVRLYCLPPKIPDPYVIRVLNQFGQVVAPLERSYYKGVDVCERTARIYVCRKIPQTLNVCGYESPAKISSPAKSLVTILSSSVESKTLSQHSTSSISGQCSTEFLRSVGDTTPYHPQTRNALHHQSTSGGLHSPSVLHPRDAGHKDEMSSGRNPCPCLSRRPREMSLAIGGDMTAESVQLRSPTGNCTPTTPPTEVSFYRSLSTGQDARRRSSASRFHLVPTSTLKGEESISEDHEGQSDVLNQNVMIAQGRRLGSRGKSRKQLPWFSCIGRIMSTGMSGGSFSTPHFCLLCNTGLEHLRSPSPTNTKGQSQGLAVVPLSSSVSGGSSDENETTCERMKEEDSALSQSNKNDQDEQELCEADWIKKYQVFLSKALHINLEKYMKDGMELLNTGTGENETLEDVAMFCMKCKKKVQHLYDVNENVQKTAKAFEDLRDGIANTIARTFVHHKMLSEDTPKPESAEIETEKITRTNSLLQAWKPIYTGEADRLLKEHNLIAEVREEAYARRDESYVKTEFPVGTEVSAMELAKMQRMMTACYFTPKMSIVRKNGKQFFRVGMPRLDKDKTYLCRVCEEVFNHQRSLNVHMRRHNKRNSIRHLVQNCLKCGESFKDRRDSILHKRRHHKTIHILPGGNLPILRTKCPLTRSTVVMPTRDSPKITITVTGAEYTQ